MRLGLVLLAALVPVALIALWLARGGALDAALDGYLGFNLAKNSGGLFSLVLFNLSYGLLREPTALLLGVLAAAGLATLLTSRPPARHQLQLLILLIAIGLVTSLIQRPWYSSRMLPMLPPLVLAAVLGAGAILGRGEPLAESSSKLLRAMVGTSLALALLVVIREPLAESIASGLPPTAASTSFMAPQQPMCEPRRGPSHSGPHRKTPALPGGTWA